MTNGSYLGTNAQVYWNRQGEVREDLFYHAQINEPKRSELAFLTGIDATLYGADRNRMKDLALVALANRTADPNERRRNEGWYNYSAFKLQKPGRRVFKLGKAQWHVEGTRNSGAQHWDVHLAVYKQNCRVRGLTRNSAEVAEYLRWDREGADNWRVAQIWILEHLEYSSTREERRVRIDLTRVANVKVVHHRIVSLVDGGECLLWAVSVG